MANILSVYETFDERGGSVNDQREREYTRSFNVEVASRTTDWNEVRLATGVPRPWTPYVGANGAADLGSWCREVRGRQDTANPYLWRVTASYSSRVERPDINQIENPLLRPADISWGEEEVMRPAYTDRGGNAILNSSDERFDPPIEVAEHRLRLTVTRNQLNYDALYYLDFLNTVNEKAWFGFQRGRVLCKRIPASRAFENGLLFWRVTFEFLIRTQLDEDELDEEGGGGANDEEASANAWATKVLDQGYHEIVDGKQVRARDKLGQPTATPVLLDGNGVKLEHGDDPVFLFFHLYPEKDFTPLLLP